MSEELLPASCPDEGGSEFSLPDEERKRILSAIEKMMELGMGAVYGVEEEGVSDADIACEDFLKNCGARCCSLSFALTKEEADKGLVRHNISRPFFIAREADGYCTHLDRASLKCLVYADRPLRCRRYDCRKE